MDLSVEHGLTEFLSRWQLEGLVSAFVAGGWLGRSLSELTAEDLADLGVPRAVRGEVLAALRAAASEELAATLGSWMTPLAHAAAEYRREEHPRLRLWAACDVVEMALRLIVIIGLAQLRRAHGGSLPRDRLVRVFQHIRTPTLSHWRAMASETAEALEDGTAESRELGAVLVTIARTLSDLVGHGSDAEITSLLRLRNMLAHGSISTAFARDLADRWRVRIEDAFGKLEPLAHLPLLARAADDTVLRIKGEAGSVEVVHDVDPDVVGSRTGAAAIRLTDRVLPLAPFVLRDVPRVGDFQGSREIPHIFLRRGEIVLEYMTLGAEDAAFGQGDDEHFQDFERLFETPHATSDRRFQMPGFERELRRDADQFLGRASELEAIWDCATSPERKGLYWLYGPPGIGKSILMARLMVDLIDEAEERRMRGTGEPWLIIAYRFRAGHESCRSSYFLAFLRERLSEAVTDAETESAIRGLDDRQAVLLLLPLAAQKARVLVPLDGLDEIVAAEPNFLSLILANLVGAGGLWLCAGRPEGQLPEFMRRNGAQMPMFPRSEDEKELAPGELGRMKVAAIRAMILEKAGPLGRKLLTGDRDSGDGQSVVNVFVDTVARKAEGLPLYVRYVIGDILGNRLRFLDGREAEGLPPSLTAYYDELVQRCAVGDDHVLATYALCLLALAHENLSEAAIADLVSRHHTIVGDLTTKHIRVRSALGRLGGALTGGFTPEGEVGFRIYHESLGEHLRQTPLLAGARRDMMDKALCPGATNPGPGAAANYLYRNGVRHLIEAGRTMEAVQAVTNVEYLIGRLGSPNPARMISQTVSETLTLSEVASNNARLGWWRRLWAALETSLNQIAVAGGFGHTTSLAAFIQAVRAVRDPNSFVEWQRTRPIDVPGLVISQSNPIESNNAYWWRMVDNAHDGPVSGISTSDDFLLTWGGDGSIRLWSAAGETLGKINAVHRSIQHVSIASARAMSDCIVSAGHDGAIRFWSKAGERLQGGADNAHRRGVAGLTESGNHLISWGNDGDICLWSKSGELLSRMYSPFEIGGVTASPGRLVGWGRGGHIHIWLESGEPLAKIDHAHGGQYGVLGVISMNDRLASWGADHAIHFWSETGKRLSGGSDTAHASPQIGMAHLRDRLVSWGYYDGIIRFWSLSGEDLGICESNQRDVRGVLASKDWLVSWAWNSIYFWTKAGKLIEAKKGITKSNSGIEQVLVAGDRLVSWAADDVSFWSTTGEFLGGAKLPHSSQIWRMAVAKSHPVSGSRDGAIRFWPAHDEPIIHRRKEHDAEGILLVGDRVVSWDSEGGILFWSASGDLQSGGSQKAHSAVVGGVLMAGDHLVSWDPEGVVRFWSLSGDALGGFRAGHGRLNGMLATSDRLITCHVDGDIRFWSPSGEALGGFKTGDHLLRGVVAINGRLVSWADGTGYFSHASIRLWSFSGELLQGGGVFSNRIVGVLALEDRLVSWSGDGRVDFWTSSGNRLPCQGYFRRPSMIEPSERGRGGIVAGNNLIASWWSEDNAIYLWSTDGEPLGSIPRAHAGRIAGVVAAGEWLVSWGTTDRTIRIWTQLGKPYACWVQPDDREIKVAAQNNRLFLMHPSGPRELKIERS